MKPNRWIAFFGVVTATLLLSGCMAAMMPAMMLGHAGHKKDNGAHGRSMKSCECEKSVAPNSTAATASDAAKTEQSMTPATPAHKH